MPQRSTREAAAPLGRPSRLNDCASAVLGAKRRPHRVLLTAVRTVIASRRRRLSCWWYSPLNQRSAAGWWGPLSSCLAPAGTPCSGLWLEYHRLQRAGTPCPQAPRSPLREQARCISTGRLAPSIYCRCPGGSCTSGRRPGRAGISPSNGNGLLSSIEEPGVAAPACASWPSPRGLRRSSLSSNLGSDHPAHRPTS